jgi:negative regulator of sigma-B (phosphoserine phosphatase)
MGAVTVTVSTTGYRPFEYGVAARPLPGELRSGDLHAVIPFPQGFLVAMVDGLGHGYEATLAAKVAVITLSAQPHRPVDHIVKRCHEALIKTRGVAMSIASLDWRDETMTWLSIGNVEGLLLHADERGGLEREHILMRGGIVGHRLPSLRTAILRLHQGDLLIFATDGIGEGFQEEVRLDARPQEIADRILARYGKATDDALVLVGRWNGPPTSRDATN